MLIRPFEEADADAVWAIVEPIIRGGAEYALDRDMSRDAAMAYWCGADRETFVAEVEGAVLGTYYLRANQAGGGRHVSNCGYAVSAAARGRGIETGTVFMNRADYLDPGLCWTGCKETGRGAALSILGYQSLTRPKSYHLRKKTG